MTRWMLAAVRGQEVGSLSRRGAGLEATTVRACGTATTWCGGSRVCFWAWAACCVTRVPWAAAVVMVLVLLMVVLAAVVLEEGR